MTKDLVLDYLWSHADESVSGEELAVRLELSRTAVWKAVEQLRQEGYHIESAPRRGYRLLSKSDVLNRAGIARFLEAPGVRPALWINLGAEAFTGNGTESAGPAPEPAGDENGDPVTGDSRPGESVTEPEPAEKRQSV